MTAIATSISVIVEEASDVAFYWGPINLMFVRAA